MKRVLAIVLALMLVIGGLGFASTTASMAKSGMVKEFTETTVSVLENGKLVTYKVHDQAAVTSGGMDADFAGTINKGLVITYTVAGGMIKAMDIPSYGIQTQGEIMSAPAVSQYGFLTALNLQSIDTRINTTDSNLLPANNATTTFTTKVIGEEADEDGMVRTSDTVITFPDAEIVAGSAVVTFDGKAMATPADYVVKLEPKKNGTITFTKAIPAADFAKIKVTYKKVITEITGKETSRYPYAKDMLIELNGKEVPVIIDGVNAFVNTNLAGQVCYVNSYYKDQKMVFYGMHGTRMVVGLLKGDTVLLVDRLTVSPDASVMDANGDMVALSSLKGNTRILLTTDPDLGFQVVSVFAQK